MFLKLAFLLVLIPLICLPALFNQIAVSSENGTTTYGYNHVPWIFLALIVIAFIAFGEYVRRALKDIWGALIFYAGVPVMAFLSLQLVYEQTKLSDDRLVYTREPPHTNCNASIDWKSIVTATKVQHENHEPLVGPQFRIGYKFVLQDGTKFELPSSTTLTAAATAVDDKLKNLGIPVNVETILKR